MRKIDKICDLSTAYKAWQDQLEQEGKAHPKYNSSSGKYYWDVVMQLFRCQKGLCAYTEQELCTEALFEESCWENGRYKDRPPSEMGRTGQLDHFDETLKSKKGDEEGLKDWLWENFFMVESTINNRKGTKSVDEILKPDNIDYNPYELLDYDVEAHLYLPNDALDENEAKSVKEMIKTLGLNQVNPRRKKKLQKKFRTYRLEGQQFTMIDEFPTAYEFCKIKLANNEVSLEELGTY